MAKKKTKQSSFTKWLGKLQQESWQLELLISGMAIYALAESLQYIHYLYIPAVEIADSSGVVGVIFIVVILTLNSGIYIFLINLVFHILIRSLWIGAIGLRYVSGDINYENLGYSAKFTNYLKKRIGNFDSYIQKLENFSSILFSYTFLLFFILLSLCLYFGLLAICLNIIRNTTEFFSKVASVFSFIVLGLGLVVAFDFITLGLLKRIKNKYFSTIYLAIYRFYATVTLSFLWRPMLLNFLDQKYTRRLFILIIPYLFFLFAISNINFITNGFYPEFYNQIPSFQSVIDEESFNFSFYDDERSLYSNEDPFYQNIKEFSLPSKKLNGQLGEIFIKATHGDNLLIHKVDSTLQPLKEEGFEHDFLTFFSSEFNEGQSEAQRKTQIDALRKNTLDEQLWRKKRDSLMQVFNEMDKKKFKQDFQKSKAILKNAVLLSIDNQKISPEQITCDYYNHPDGKAKGLLCFYPLDSLSIGRHYLTVGKVQGMAGNSRFRVADSIYLDTTYQTIPFIYTGNY